MKLRCVALFNTCKTIELVKQWYKNVERSNAVQGVPHLVRHKLATEAS
jgi:hypothetical protein